MLEKAKEKLQMHLDFGIQFVYICDQNYTHTRLHARLILLLTWARKSKTREKKNNFSFARLKRIRMANSNSKKERNSDEQFFFLSFCGFFLCFSIAIRVCVTCNNNLVGVLKSVKTQWENRFHFVFDGRKIWLRFYFIFFFTSAFRRRRNRALNSLILSERKVFLCANKINHLIELRHRFEGASVSECETPDEHRTSRWISTAAVVSFAASVARNRKTWRKIFHETGKSRVGAAVVFSTHTKSSFIFLGVAHRQRRKHFQLDNLINYDRVGERCYRRDETAENVRKDEKNCDPRRFLAFNSNPTQTATSFHFMLFSASSFSRHFFIRLLWIIHPDESANTNTISNKLPTVWNRNTATSNEEKKRTTQNAKRRRNITFSVQIKRRRSFWPVSFVLLRP